MAVCDLFGKLASHRRTALIVTMGTRVLWSILLREGDFIDEAEKQSSFLSERSVTRLKINSIKA